MGRINAHLYPCGTLSREGWESAVDDRISGWRYTGLRVAELSGRPLALPAADVERLIVPLAGGCTVALETATVQLDGRESVFAGPTDCLFLGARQGVAVTGYARVAVAEAPTCEVRPNRHITAADVPVEVRGAGAASRQVHNFGTPESLDAAALIVCEVITPAGNWSSYPAHKHDDPVPGGETQLEEIYYFEAAPACGRVAPAPADAFGFFATSSSPAGEIETRALVRTGDVALVPFGYHGPAVAAPDYDLYYLNVMAGPERRWHFSDDPTQAWIRSAWAGQPTDPRLPYGRSAHARGAS